MGKSFDNGLTGALSLQAAHLKSATAMLHKKRP
jgi:hypothetical protein